jgi:hypothetical protein
MKKKDDMKKLSKDGSIGFQQDNLYLLFFLLIFNSFPNLYSQTLLNNFGISSFVKTYPGYTDFIYLDYNKDGIRDLLLYGNQEKNFVLHNGLQDSTYANAQKKFFFFPINDIKFLNKSKNGEDYFIFVSRNKRIAGLVSFTPSYSLQLLNTIEFNSYPSSINIVDLDKDGKNEALIYGNNFDGIVKVSNEGFKLVPETIYSESVYSDITSFDFNQDELDDLICVDVLNNSISFLENYELNGFSKSREILSEDVFHSLQKVDINQDDFFDLVLVKEKGLEVFLGDSVYSFADSYNINTSVKPDKFVFTDLNLDDKLDLVYMSRFDNQLVLNSDFSEEKSTINYTISGLTDFRINKKFSTNSLLLLSKKGKIQRITSKNRWSKKFNFSIGGQPNLVKYAKWKDSEISYFLIQNEVDNSVNQIKMDSKGNLVNLTNYSFLNNFTDFTFTNKLNNLIGYSKQARLIEIVNLSSDDKINYNQHYLYTTYPIIDFEIDINNDFKILETNKNKIYFETISKNENKYVLGKMNFIDSMVTNSKMISQNLIYYWQLKKNKYSFIKSTVDSKKELISLNLENDSIPKSSIIYDKSDVANSVVTIFNDGKTEKVFLVKNDKVQTYKSNIRLFNESQQKDKDIKLYNKLLGPKTLMVYKPLQKRILFLEFDDKKNLLQLTNSVEAIEINDYFVNQFFGKKYLVYSDNFNNCISFRVLK